MPQHSFAIPRLSRTLRIAAAAVALGVAGRTASAQDVRPPAELRDSVVALARAQIGARYVRGGSSPSRGFDCSGLVKYVLSLLDVASPRTARLQARLGEAVAVDRAALQPGDILTFGRSNQGASHVAIYVGDGRYVHASVTAGRVIETTLDRPGSSLVRAWRGVRRLFTAGTDTTS
jgi:cell wall-associated NlpC family hydrolase